jgi:hypothetical protein
MSRFFSALRSWSWRPRFMQESSSCYTGQKHQSGLVCSLQSAPFRQQSIRIALAPKEGMEFQCPSSKRARCAPDVDGQRAWAPQPA